MPPSPDLLGSNSTWVMRQRNVDPTRSAHSRSSPSTRRPQSSRSDTLTMADDSSEDEVAPLLFRGPRDRRVGRPRLLISSGDIVLRSRVLIFFGGPRSG